MNYFQENIGLLHLYKNDFESTSDFFSDFSFKTKLNIGISVNVYHSIRIQTPFSSSNLIFDGFNI